MYLVPLTHESRQLSRLFDDTLDRVFGTAPAAEGRRVRSPALDVAESDAGYTVKLEVPGVTKEDVKISVEGRQVNVQAQSQQSEEKKDGDRIVYQERSVSSYSRSFTLPQEVEQGDAAAKLENGVLTLTLPKRSARSAARITVN